MFSSNQGNPEVGGEDNFWGSEVMKQVTERGSVGVVSIPDWKVTFLPHLGALRAFLESRPEFVVIPKRGGKFNVAPAGAFPDHGVHGHVPIHVPV